MLWGKCLGSTAMFLASLLLWTVCGKTGMLPENNRESVTVAAAANLTDAFDELGKVYPRKVGVHVVYSYRATTQLAQIIQHSVPSDVIAAADTDHIDDLVQKA